MTRKANWGITKARPRVVPTSITVTAYRMTEKAGWQQVVGCQMVTPDDLDGYIISLRRIYAGPADLLIMADYDYTVAVEEPMSPYYG